MIVDVSAVVDSFAEAVTLRRYAASTWAKGKATAGAATDTTIRGVVQPINARELDRLPEGERSRARLVLWTTTSVRTTTDVDGLPGDQVVYGGTVYDCGSLRDWSQHGQFDRVALLEIT